MKRFFQAIIFILLAVIGLLVFANLKQRWEAEERLAAINQALNDRIARAAAENARRNQIATKLQQDALREEAQTASRWNAAKENGKLPGNNTEPGFTPATGNAFRQTGTRY